VRETRLSRQAWCGRTLAIDRHGKLPEPDALARAQYEKGPTDPDGRLRSPLTGIQLRAANSKLILQFAADPASQHLLP